MVEHPFIYEINTWVWLDELRARLGREIGLDGVPAAEWEAIAARNFDAVWLMGVWQRSPAGIAIALENESLLESFESALPGYTTADVVGSPYCVSDYTVAEHLGGADGLRSARKALADQGLKLILDFVPNHVAPDHPWIGGASRVLRAGRRRRSRARPGVVLPRAGGAVLANGRDPFFPPWTDVVQLNAFSPGLRRAVIDTLDAIADQCDGVRCDMAMLVLDDVFERTWGGARRRRARPSDFWADGGPAGQARGTPASSSSPRPTGTWSGRCSSRVSTTATTSGSTTGSSTTARRGARPPERPTPATSASCVRFLENHDEPRAATTFPPGKAQAAAVTTLSQTGARLVHEGQLDGRRVHVPVFLARRPEEAPDADLRAFYERLFAALADPVFRTGDWQLGERRGWEGNDAWQNLICWGWRDDSPRKLVVVNLGDVPAAGHVALAWDDLRATGWHLEDASSGEVYERSGDDLRDGLYVALDPWASNIFDLAPVNPED